jgi:hypothetical protein
VDLVGGLRSEITGQLLARGFRAHLITRVPMLAARYYARPQSWLHR